MVLLASQLGDGNVSAAPRGSLYCILQNRDGVSKSIKQKAILARNAVPHRETASPGCNDQGDDVTPSNSR